MANTKNDDLQIHPQHRAGLLTGRPHPTGIPALDKSALAANLDQPKQRGQAPVNQGMARKQFHPDGSAFERAHPNDENLGNAVLNDTPKADNC